VPERSETERFGAVAAGWFPTEKGLSMSGQVNEAARPGATAGSGAAPSSGTEGGDRPRRRPPPRRVEVVSVSQLAPRLVSVRLGGEGLTGFRAPAPTSHIKVFLPAPGQDAPSLPQLGPDGPAWTETSPRPAVRTYTPRLFDETDGTLDVQFVLHSEGPAAAWAQRARVGDQLAIAGPGGRFALDSTVQRWWIGGDESALTAIGTLLDALPASATAEVHVEVAGPDDEIPLISPAQTTIVWHYRRTHDGWGEELYDAAKAATIADGTQVWVACEAVAVRRIRNHLLVERQMPAGAMVTRGYWRCGVADHPDHDYGDD
jgi:NADPH-dependent ferric siderophore reductase